MFQIKEIVSSSVFPGIEVFAAMGGWPGREKHST